MMEQQHAAYLSQTDTVMWTVESDPLLRSTIIGVVLLDTLPDWEQFVARMEHVTHMVPEMRKKVVSVPLHPTTLRWEIDPDLDLSYHVRRVAAPSPGTLREVLDLARTSAQSGFDRTRPLWEFTLVEGLADGGAALVMKAHHVVTDGIGAVQLAAHLFDLSADAPMPESGEHEEPGAGRGSGLEGAIGLVREVIAHDVDGVVQFARRTMPSVVPTLFGLIRDPFHAIAETIETIQSVGRVVTPVTTTLSPVMTERHREGRFEVLELPFGELYAAARAAEATVNDAFLAGITGGLRRYHEALGVGVDELRIAMPISLRTDDNDAGGNHITVLRFKVPVGIDEPRERIRRLHEIGHQIRSERSLVHTEAIAGFLNLMPKGVLGAMLKHVDFLASNVPGVSVPLYLAGARVRRFFPFGPTAGSSLNVTLMTYDGTCCIGVNTDSAAIPDTALLMRCLGEGFDEVVALAGGHAADHRVTRTPGRSAT